MKNSVNNHIRLFCVLLAVCLLLSGCGKSGSQSQPASGSAAEHSPAPTVYTARETEAVSLRNLGLLKGGPWGFELERTATRMEAVIFAIRLGGHEKAALESQGECPFSDAPTWFGADRYLAYAVQTGLVDAAGGLFRPDDAATAGDFAHMAMQELGYLSDSPLDKAVEMGLWPAGAFSDENAAITKNDCVLLMYNALKTQTFGGKTLAESLVESGAISAGGARKEGFLAPEPAPEYKRYDSVPVLMYHVIADFTGTNESLYLSPADFQAHLDYFEANGIHTVTLSDVYDNWYNNKPLPDKPIVLSFDDGYRSVYTEAFTRMVQKGYTGVFFLYTDYIGVDESCLSQDMVDDMAANGMEFGSHTVSHCDLTAVSAEQQRHEIVDSRTLLQGITGQKINFLCYPSGRNNDAARALGREGGYLGAVTTQPGLADYTDDLFGLDRIRIDKGCGAGTLASKLPY